MIQATAPVAAAPDAHPRGGALAATGNEPSATPKDMLDEALAKINPPTGQASDFAGARDLLLKVSELRPNDPFVTQQLVVATYKSKLPAPGSALLEARAIMEKSLNPASTNDPETLGLWGAIHKRLWEIDARPEDLNAAVDDWRWRRPKTRMPTRRNVSGPSPRYGRPPSAAATQPRQRAGVQRRKRSPFRSGCRKHALSRGASWSNCKRRLSRFRQPWQANSLLAQIRRTPTCRCSCRSSASVSSRAARRSGIRERAPSILPSHQQLSIWPAIS